MVIEDSFIEEVRATGVAVTDLQRKLASLDARAMPELAALQELRCANPDSAATPCGQYGAETEAAVNAFKRRYGLGLEDGICADAKILRAPRRQNHHPCPLRWPSFTGWSCCASLPTG